MVNLSILLSGLALAINIIYGKVSGNCEMPGKLFKTIGSVKGDVNTC